MLAKFGQLLRAIAAGPDPSRLPPPQEVIPTLPLMGPVDFEYSRDSHLYSGYALEAAVAANYAHIQLFLPAATGVMVIIRSMHFSCAQNVLLFGRSGAAYDDDGTEGALDLRTYAAGRGAPCARVQTRTYTGTTPTAIMRLYPTATDGASFFYHYDMPLVLMPGYGFMVCQITVNEALQGGFVWSERAYDQEEVRGCQTRLFA